MLFRCISALIFALAASLVLTLDASASSRFKVQNDTDKHVFVSIFSGGDHLCVAEENSKRVDAESDGAFGCTGNGKHRCKLKFYSADEKQICKRQGNSCPNDSARKMKNGAKVVISKDAKGDFICAFY